MLMQRDVIGDVHAERALLMQSLFERYIIELKEYITPQYYIIKLFILS